MKKISLILFLLAFLYPRLQAQLLSYEEIAEYNISELQTIADDLGVFPGVISYNHEVKVYKVLYQMDDTNDEPIQVSGALVVPQNTSCGLPIASYQHGTIIRKTSVPSQLSAELDIGLLYATNGMVLTMPDYQGLGESPGLHPYIHAESEARAVAGLILAAQQLADTLNFPLNEQLFLFGYSQGGHATMAAHRYIQQELAGALTVTASSPMAGPYDVSGVQANVITADVSYPTPNYLPYILFAYQSVYGNLYSDPSDVLIPPYDTLLPPLFDGTFSSFQVDAVMPSIPNRILKPEVLDSFRNDPNHRIRVALRDNDVYDWTPEAPIRLVYCMGDDQVSFENSIVARDQFMANGVVDVETLDLGDSDHVDCAFLAIISGLGFFKRFWEENNFISVDAAEVSGSTGMDGSISVTASGGVGELSYSWSNGGTTAMIDGLTAGTYTLVLSDATGCSIEQRYRVDMLTSVQTLAEGQPLRLSPNPARDWLEVVLPEAGRAADVRLFDMRGRRVVVAAEQRSSGLTLDLGGLQPGLYVLELQQGAQRYVGKFAILRAH
ncbi:MAG: T9SS type A sorting domain-containing protein [Bacteroidota bacterium]